MAMAFRAEPCSDDCLSKGKNEFKVPSSEKSIKYCKFGATFKISQNSKWPKSKMRTVIIIQDYLSQSTCNNPCAVIMNDLNPRIIKNIILIQWNKFGTLLRFSSSTSFILSKYHSDGLGHYL